MTALATRTDENGRPETVTPDCPYCDKPATGKTVNYGGSLMHEHCYDAFGREMASAFPDELAPLDPELFEDAFDPDWCQPEDETLCRIVSERHHDDETAGTILVDEDGDTLCSGGVLWDDEVPF